VSPPAIVGPFKSQPCKVRRQSSPQNPQSGVFWPLRSLLTRHSWTIQSPTSYNPSTIESGIQL